MPGTTHPRRSSGGDGECRCGQVLGGGALGRARRVFYEDKRRSNEPHLGPDASQERRRSSGAVLLHELLAAGTRDVGTEKEMPMARAASETESQRRSRGRFSGAAMLVESGTRGDRGTRVCSWVGDTAGLMSIASFCAVKKRRSARSGSPGRASRCGEETKEAPRAQPKPATVHAAWRRKPRLSGTTRGSSQDDLRADAGGRNRALPGSPRSDEASEVRTAGATGEDNAPGIRLSSLK